MREELVAKIAAKVKELLDDHEFDPKYYARACLAEIEASGMVVVPREPTPEIGQAMYAAGSGSV